MTTRRSEPISEEIRRGKQIGCIVHDLATIRSYAARANAIMDLERLDLPRIELPQLDELEKLMVARLEQIMAEPS